MALHACMGQGLSSVYPYSPGLIDLNDRLGTFTVEWSMWFYDQMLNV